MSPRAAGLPHTDVRRLRVLRGPMVRIAPRLGPPGWHLDVTPQRHSVIEKAPSDPLPRNPTDDRPYQSSAGRSLARAPIGAAAQRSRRATVGLGSAVGGARERCGPATAATPARSPARRSQQRRLRLTDGSHPAYGPHRAARVVHFPSDHVRRPRHDAAARGRCGRSIFKCDEPPQRPRRDSAAPSPLLLGRKARADPEDVGDRPCRGMLDE
jgi:hypothetical protein